MWRRNRVDCFQLNWRLVLATQLIGESQVGGSIISTMLDLGRDAFWSNWVKLGDTTSVAEWKIGARVANLNLKKETLGKVAVLCNGKEKYPVAISYDMGLQKATKTYDSLSGQGLMIGDRTKMVITYKNYSRACCVCEDMQGK